VWEGVVVDDYNVIGCVPRTLSPTGTAADTLRVQAADAAYAREGRVPKASKCFDHEDIFHIWGGTVDGEGGSSQAGAALQGRLICLALRMLYGGRTTPGYWKAMIGLLSYCAFVGGRTAFAMFDAVYFEAADLADGEVFLPSGRARCEVECLLAFLPFMYVDLRAPVSERLFATDASSRSAAIVESRVPALTAREMWRFRYRKGTASTELRTLAGQFADRMDAGLAEHTARALLGLAELAAADAREEGVELDEGAGDPPAWSAALADALPWKPIWHGPVDVRSHINRKEAVPIGLLARRLARDPSAQGKRYVVAVDSSVNVASWAKGRSRSRALNSVLRRACPEQMLGGVRLGYVHVRSAHNPADDPTRGRPVRSRARFVPYAGSPLGQLLAGTPMSHATLGRVFGVDTSLPAALFAAGESPRPWSP
jgi:hypothetical protein